MPTISDLDRSRMDEITAGLPTKSEKIRRLAAAGFKRADIARYLDIRYQHVRNVLTGPQPTKGMNIKPRNGPAAPVRSSGSEGRAAVPGAERQWIWTAVGKGGRIDIPATFLETMGVAEGDPIQLAVEGDALRILSRDAVIREVQAYVRRYIPKDVSLVDELLKERRAEAAREEADADE
ncbi:MAG: AbrB/MazE/SpoVT family DNA-binding domain-containing protein [Kiloniellaceae bacterium]